MKLTTLQRSATRTTTRRGHRLRWERHAKVWTGTCRRCGDYVQVNATPAPNGITIGGSAVAQNCRKGA